MKELEEYARIARYSGAFKDIELDLLLEGVEHAQAKPGQPNRLVELRDGRTLAGFALLHKALGTDHSYEVSGICLDPHYLGTVASAGLVARMEEELLLADTEAILRIELSDAKREAAGLQILPDLGYTLIGHIPDFYEPGADYYMYARHIARPHPEGKAPKGDSGERTETEKS